MKNPFPAPTRRIATGGLLAAAAILTTSCKLPPREAWSQIQQRGLIPVVFASPTTPGGEPQRMTASAPAPREAAPEAAVKVNPVLTPEVSRMPVARPVPGRDGYVFSPFVEADKPVDVREFHAGDEARCPYTLKSFVVPDFALIAAERRESKPSAPAPRRKPATQVVSNTRLKLPEPAPRIVPPPPQDAIPYGSRVPGRPGYVFSPFASRTQLVDVAGIAPGVEVTCPYTNKVFRVPEPLAEEIPAVPSPRIPTAPSGPPEPQSPAPNPTPANPEPAPATNPEPGPIPQPPAAPPAPEPRPANPGASLGGSLGGPPGGSLGAPAPSLPTAQWSDQSRNLVQSPFGAAGQLVDVTGKGAGSIAVCPFSGKEFRVPGN